MQIVSPLGAGGMGEVYRARDSKLGRDVAIKILPPAVHRRSRSRRALRARSADARGAQSSAHRRHLRHRGSPPTRHDRAALMLELVEGETLAERIARGALPVGEALCESRGQIADALDAAHEKGIVHRDLKPANIKITAGGRGQGSRLRPRQGLRQPVAGCRLADDHDARYPERASCWAPPRT